MQSAAQPPAPGHADAAASIAAVDPIAAPTLGTGSERVGVAVMVDSLMRPGGGERLAVENAVRLSPDRFNRFFVITRWEDTLLDNPASRLLLEQLEQAGVELIRIRRRSRFSLLAWRPLLSLLRTGRVDILHGHLFGSNVWASLLGSLTGTRVVVAHEHMWAYAGGSGLRPLLDRQLIARAADAFVAVSRQGVRGMLEIERIPAEVIAYVPNGVRALPPGDGAGIRAELAIPVAAPLIVSVGHLRGEKAFEVLIEALAQLRRGGLDAHALIAGEGPERGRLEGLAADCGVAGALHMPGARDDVADLLAAADVAVCCSRFEGGPLSVMEYMQAGLPVVASDAGGLPELVTDGVSGLLAAPGHADAFATAIERLLADGALAARLGAAGRELVTREHGIDVWIARLESLYTQLLGRTSTSLRRGRRRGRPGA